MNPELNPQVLLAIYQQLMQQQQPQQMPMQPPMVQQPQAPPPPLAAQPQTPQGPGAGPQVAQGAAQVGMGAMAGGPAGAAMALGQMMLPYIMNALFGKKDQLGPSGRVLPPPTR